MSWAEVSKINSDFMDVPLDKRLDLADYKMYGEKSHVFQNKDRLHSLYECVDISMNDHAVNGEALDYLLKTQNAGEVLTLIHELEQKEQIRRLSTMPAIANDTTAMTAVLKSNTAISAIANSITAMTAVANSSTAMTAVANSSTAMTAVANSSTAITAVLNNTTAITAVANSSTAMTAVANSSMAMTAVANSSTAITAVLNNTTAITAVANSSTAMTAVANSSTAMTAVANSSTVITAVANSSTAMTAVLNSDEAVKKLVNSSLISEVELRGNTWDYLPDPIPVKGIIISFYCPYTNNALAVRRIDKMLVTDRNDDRNAAPEGKNGWEIWLARYSKNPAYNVMKKSITVAAAYINCKMRYIPIN